MKYINNFNQGEIMIKTVRTLDFFNKMTDREFSDFMNDFTENIKSVKIEKSLTDDQLQMILNRAKENKIENLDIFINKTTSQTSLLFGYLRSQEANHLKTLNITTSLKTPLYSVLFAAFTFPLIASYTIANKMLSRSSDNEYKSLFVILSILTAGVAMATSVAKSEKIELREINRLMSPIEEHLKSTNIIYNGKFQDKIKQNKCNIKEHAK